MPERDEYDGSVFAPRAAPGFAQRRRVRVVGHKRADPEIFFDLRAQRNVVPGNVVAVIDDAVFAVYCPRRTDADRRDVGHGYVRVRRDLSHEPRHVGGDFAVRAVLARRDLIRANDRARFVYDSALDERAAKIQARIIFHISSA